MLITKDFNTLQADIEACRHLRLHAVVSSEIDSDTKALIYESILLRGFRSYENAIEALFLDYLTGETKPDGTPVLTFVSPKDLAHARKLIHSSRNARHLDWASVETVRARCQVFLEQDDPIYTAIVDRTNELTWMRKVRNHIAHNSVESALQYESVLTNILLTKPEPFLRAGSFLQMIPTSGPIKGREVLAYFLDTVESVARTAAAI